MAWQSTQPTSTRVSLVLHAVTAASLLLAASVATWATDRVSYLGSVRDVLLAGGLLALLSGLIRRPAWLTALSSRLCLVILSSVLTIALTEAALRLLRFDFRQQEAWIEKTPPGFRRPLVPTGTVFFRHRGNVVWTGQVQATHLKLLGYDASAYENEPTITLRYDQFGFRNEPRPEQWVVTVAGDSFTELGDVPFENLFTTQLGQALDCEVLNLGVADTGPLTQLSYLYSYGLSPATRHAVIVFFEGNDLRDITVEHAAEQHYERTGFRSTRPIRPQSSFIQAIGEWFTQRAGPTERSQPRVHALFMADRRKIPVTLDAPPPATKDLTPIMREALDSFFSRYAALSRERSIRVWLAYMPSKIRVLYGSLEFRSDSDPTLGQWRPTDLPEQLAERCSGYGVGFIDLTPDLVAHTESSRELVFNHLHDCHLNARGSQVVAGTLSKALRDQVTSPTP